MEEILIIVESLSKADIAEGRSLQREFYKKFCKFKCTEKNEETYLSEYVFPKLQLLYDKQILRKDIVYLMLMAHNNLEILEKCIGYDKLIFQLNIADPSSLYDYTIFKKHHWFYEVLSNYDKVKGIFNKNISNKILALKLIEVTNVPDISVEQIKTYLENVDTVDIDPFWKYYIKEIGHIMNIVDFCKGMEYNVDANEIFFYMSEHCSLETFSKYIDIAEVEWKEILNKLYEEEELHSHSDVQSQQFLAFYILGSIFKIVLNENNTKLNVNETLEDIKSKILSLKSKLLQIEMLENIFAILFLKARHILQNVTEEEFICKEKQIRLILYFIKMVIDEVKLKHLYAKDSEGYFRFNNLNKYVTDAIWRTELIEDIKEPVKCENNLLKYMLAPPQSLIQMCLKRSDFKRTYQVIEIFGLKESFLSSETEYLEKLQILRKDLKKAFKMWEIQKVNPNKSLATIEPDVTETVMTFFKNNPIPYNPDTEQLITNLCEHQQVLSHFKYENEAFMNMLDLAITQSKHFEHCASLIHLAFDNNSLDRSVDSNYSIFCTKLFETWKEIAYDKNLTLLDIIISPDHYLDLNKYKKEEQFFENLAELYEEFYHNLNVDESGVLNSNHSSHKSLLKLNSLCNEFVEWNQNGKDNVKYIAKLYNYLKAFSKILYIEQNSSDIVSQGRNTSYFNLLYHNRSELMGKLLFERHLDPSEFEKYFAKLKLDYLYHVIGNCFPTINLHSEENVTKEELYPENSLYVPSKSIITYIQKRNWLLAFILSEMYKLEDVKIDVSKVRVRPFLNYMKLPKIQYLKVLFENNEIITALQNEISAQKMSQYVNMKILKNDYLSSSQYSQTSNDSFEAAQEILEDAIKTTNWKELYDIVDSIPDNHLRKSPVLIELKDMVLVNLVQDRFEINYFRYVQFISDVELRITTILYNIKQWPGEFCIDLIKSEITKFETVQNTKISELKTWLRQIELCEELRNVVDVSNWSKAFELSKYKPNEVISKLLLCDKILTLLEFIDIHKPNENLLLEINENYFITIFETIDSYEPIRILLDSLPYNHSIKICYNLLKFLKHLDSLQFITDYLLNNVNNDMLKNVQISLKMLSVFSQSEQDQLLCLIYEPLSIIEILIMNVKLDKLSVVLDIVKTELQHTEFSENQLCVERIDEVLRNYAEKSLDFRVITQPNPRLLRTPECKLMQSIDSLSLCAENRGFVMPEFVPLKDEWVPNNEVLECMCCHKITFSMFNRRHHCRRCGRVVCYSCSTHRMLVPTYEDILVRVCEDCYHQTVGDSTTSEFTDTASTKSMIYDYWYLTDDFEHNKIVREEFSYEHAPSVSLCLSVMKYHSKSLEYPKFLLDQCDVMLKLLQPSQEPIQEIDYLLVIKMLKSLAVAAKMISVECSLHYGTSSADRILAQAELLGLLAERGCLSLLPVSSAQRGSFIDASVLRKLRDRLLEREQWNLALEVSTKAGLDITGVFAAWGKSCLKAGSLSLAREKFQRCLDKTGHYESVSETNSQSEFDTSQDSSSRGRNISKASSLVAVFETKPSKNPPLLNEIVYILESKTISINPDIIKRMENQSLTSSTLSLNQQLGTASQPDTAICIMNKLKNLKNIASGNYYQVVENDRLKLHCNPPSIDSIFYDECVHYLSKYGTHQSLLEFYIKHGDISKALNYIIDGQLSTDIFIDIYMRCLKDGVVNVLQEHISRIDSTLNLWKDYLQSICRHLEKHNMLHSLYQLQQFMGDYIRAAMTCIRFYQENVKCFADLAGNVNFLHKAESHLKEVLVQDQWVEVASVRKQSVDSGGSYEEKSLTNPSLVMKMSPKDINKNIDTIWRQKEVVTFLAGCEASDVKPTEILSSILQVEESSSQLSEKIVKIPTLFGSAQEKMHLAVLAIICGKNIEDGFNIAFGIIEEFKLKPVKVYCETGKQLAKAERYNGIGQLVSCIKHSGTSDIAVTDMCDEMLTLAVATFTKANVSGTKVEDLIKLISDRSTKISAYIEAKQLKTAYFLAVKYKRMSDIRRILREAELLNQPGIKALCQKVLLSHSHTPTH